MHVFFDQVVLGDSGGVVRRAEARHRHVPASRVLGLRGGHSNGGPLQKGGLCRLKASRLPGTMAEAPAV